MCIFVLKTQKYFRPFSFPELNCLFLLFSLQETYNSFVKWETLSDLLAGRVPIWFLWFCLWFTENYTLCSLNQHHLVISGNLVWKLYTISHFSCLCSYVDQKWSHCYTAYQSEWQEGSQKHLDKNEVNCCTNIAYKHYKLQ